MDKKLYTIDAYVRFADTVVKKTVCGETVTSAIGRGTLTFEVEVPGNENYHAGEYGVSDAKARGEDVLYNELEWIVTATDSENVTPTEEAGQ